jgi:hypothetical protein
MVCNFIQQNIYLQSPSLLTNFSFTEVVADRRAADKFTYLL